MKKIFETPHGIIYAKRTSGGGLQYFDDTCGIIASIIDMTVVNRQHLKMILDNHAEIETYFDRLPDV